VSLSVFVVVDDDDDVVVVVVVVVVCIKLGSRSLFSSSDKEGKEPNRSV